MKDDTFIKIPNSLGFRDLNLTEVFTDFSPNQSSYSIDNHYVEMIQRQVLSRWKRLLYSNIESVDLYDLSLNLTYTSADTILANETVLVVSYLIKLDPRIAYVSQIIYKILNIINSTLASPNSTVYNEVSLDGGLSNAFVLPNSPISCKCYHIIFFLILRFNYEFYFSNLIYYNLSFLHILIGHSGKIISFIILMHLKCLF